MEKEERVIARCCNQGGKGLFSREKGMKCRSTARQKSRQRGGKKRFYWGLGQDSSLAVLSLEKKDGFRSQ